MKNNKIGVNKAEIIKAKKNNMEIDKTKFNVLERERKICEIFNNIDRELIIDEKRKNDTLIILRKKIEEKQIRIINNKKLIVLNQLKYMDKSILIYHALVCVTVMLIMAIMSRHAIKKEEIILVGMTLSGLVGLISIVEISHIFSSGIAEISESCYFNVKQIVAFNMLMSGIINLTLLSMEILFVGCKWKIELMYAALYVLVPFVFTECCCMGVLFLEVGRKKTYLLIVVGIFAIAFFVTLVSNPKLYQTTAFIVWVIAFMAGLFILGMQIKILFNGIKKGEIICTN